MGAAGALAILPGTAIGQFETGFEAPDYDGSADGTVLDGQNGWYKPPVQGTIDSYVYTYDSNALGFPANPTGSDQFIGGVAQAGNLFARAQHDHDFSVADAWELCYDIAVKYSGNIPASPNLCSFSLQDSTQARFFISLNNFEDVNNPVSWKAEYNVYNAAGGALNNQSPGDAWKGLKVDHWYRICTTVDFGPNTVHRVTITDLETGETAEAAPDWYLTGGQNPVLPLPTAVRFFVGGSAGDTAGFDNLSIAEAGGPPPECYPDFTGDGALDLFDFLQFVNEFNAQTDRADCTEDGVYDLFDFLCFVNSFNAGC